MTQDLVARIRAGEERAVARGLSLVEEGGAAGQELLAAMRQSPGQGTLVGITGTPGSGKSTLTDRLIARARSSGEKVAVLAVDPSSPFSGGAILGDRIRMMRWHDDPGVFIRSLASRGQLGGLSAATVQCAVLLDAAGFDRIIIETVGVGQSEVDIATVADVTVLVLTPGQGDSVQAFKAGVMEIADIFVVNKADQPGVDRLRREIAALLSLGSYGPGDWKPPVISTIATADEGVAKLADRIRAFTGFQREQGALPERRRRRALFEIRALLDRELARRFAGIGEAELDAVLTGARQPLETGLDWLRRPA